MNKENLISKFKKTFAKTKSIKVEQVISFLEENLNTPENAEDHRKISTYEPLNNKQKTALDQGLPKGVRIRKPGESQRADAINGN
jgi:hypothetical protein